MTIAEIIALSKMCGGGGGGVSSWNDLTDRPFGESPTGGDTLTWDGNTEGRVNVAGVFYKVSDAVATMDDFADGCTLTYPSGETVNATVNSLMPGVISAVAETGKGFTFISEEILGVEIGGIAFTEAGVYVADVAGTGAYLASITIPGYTGFPLTKKIDPKYLPSVGGIKYVYINEDDDGNDTASATYAQIATWIKSGLDVKCIYAGTIVPLVGSDALSEIAMYVTSPHHTFTVMYDIPRGLEIQIYEDDYINIKWIENIE